MRLSDVLKISIVLGAFAVPVLTLASPAALALQPRCAGEPATIVLQGSPNAVFGTPDRDVVVGSDGNDHFNGEGGDDLICLGDGDDYANGGPGNDIIYGEGGDDILYGSFENDRLFGGPGKDTLSGDAGFDHCHGGPGKKDKALKSLVTGGCEKKKSIEKQG